MSHRIAWNWPLTLSLQSFNFWLDLPILQQISRWWWDSSSLSLFTYTDRHLIQGHHWTCIRRMYPRDKQSSLYIILFLQAWSITYHSWLTFVLLLWASLMWMIPNQRRSMLRCSPYIVFYAECLLIAQYIFGMNLTEKELPTVRTWKTSLLTCKTLVKLLWQLTIETPNA